MQRAVKVEGFDFNFSTINQYIRKVRIYYFPSKSDRSSEFTNSRI